MAHRTNFGFVVLIVAFALAGAAAWNWQWQQTVALRGRIGLAHLEAKERDQLRAQNERLRAHQIPVEELESLRADHAALARLRAELDGLKRAQPPAGR